MEGLLPVEGLGEELAQGLVGGDAVEDPVHRVEEGVGHQRVKPALENRQHVEVDGEGVTE